MQVIKQYAALILVISIFNCSAEAKEPSQKIDGASVYRQYCASCHPGGGNITTPSKTVAGSTKLNSLAIFKDYLKNPVGHMPYYKSVIDDEATLKALHQYCQSLKKTHIRAVSHKVLGHS